MLRRDSWQEGTAGREEKPGRPASKGESKTLTKQFDSEQDLSRQGPSSKQDGSVILN